MHERRVELFAAVVLAASALAVLYSVYAFGQHRFFTVDEYQTGHATWLISQGELPYVDFYEHHFPLSYVAHAPVVAGDASFPDRALRLRLITFVYILVTLLLLGAGTFRVTGDASAAFLAVLIPPSVGFGLMSVIEYRPDNFSAFLLLACLALLEVNRANAERGPDGRWLAGLCGVLFGLSFLMTQKVAVLGAGCIPLMLLIDRFRPSWSGGALIAKPLHFCVGAAVPWVVFLALGAWLGLLGSAFEITFVEAIRHQAFYPTIPWQKYAYPYFCAAPVSTAVIAAFALSYLVLAARPERWFWGVALGATFVGGALISVQYPYIYVLLCFIVGLCAARGFALAVRRVARALRVRQVRLAPLAPLLCIAALAVLPGQLGFVADTTSNAHQLSLLTKIERFSGPDDAVIDNSGGALFRHHGSYYYLHGDAHREMFKEYFETQLLEDYRRSQALLWIMDYRLLNLPESVHSYFLKQYVRVDGSLFALGFHTPRSRGGELSMDLDVIKAGDYFVFPAPLRLSAAPRGVEAPERSFDLMLDGEPITGETVRLEMGVHQVTVLPSAPPYFLSLVSPEAFLLTEKDRFWRELEGAKSYQLLFEYGESCW